MNRASPEMLHCFTGPGNCTEMTVFERQTARLKSHQDQLHAYFPQSLSSPIQPGYAHGPFIGSVKPDPGYENGWPELGKFESPAMDFGSGLELDPSVSNRESVLSEKRREILKKRKTNTKALSEEHSNEKRIKICAEEGDSKITDQIQTKNHSSAIRETSAETSKENSKASEVQKPDYIHVRARRGQATDSHSLAERARREKISERMKYLQDLVPGCNKITGKAGMLDEIINYVQSLQKQVEFLSMKLAAVNPRLELNVNVVEIFPKEAHPGSNFIQSEMNSPAYLQFDQSNPMGSYCALDPSISGLRRTISAPVTIPENFLESVYFPPSSTWDGDLQSLGFDQGRTEAFPSHPYAGLIEISNLKMEM